ncbi:MAG: cytochrome c [Ottowia sp.]|uniref:c-type cytochrome n=1 Tax=Ottowia sp. TaxID=1898956 RepID=UPI003C764309
MKSWAVLNKSFVQRASPMTHALAALPLLFAGMAHAQPQEPAVQHASPERGKALLAQYQCGSCHTIPGIPAARGQVSQTLRAWSQRSYIAGRLPNRPDTLARWIANPQAVVPGASMPAMGVSPDEARAMAAYLFSLE